MLSAAQKIGYSHGIALALACKACYTEYNLNDFIAAETQARQALEWYRHTPDKDHITIAV